MRPLEFRGWLEDEDRQVMVYKINSLRLVDGELQPDDYILMQFTGYIHRQTFCHFRMPI